MITYAILQIYGNKGTQRKEVNSLWSGRVWRNVQEILQWSKCWMMSDQVDMNMKKAF